MAAALRKRFGREVWLLVAVLAFAIVIGYRLNNVRAIPSCGGGGNPCIANLKQLEGAKANWALEEHRRSQDIPSVADLIGTNRYIDRVPVCLLGGTYTYGRVDQKPTCSLPGHSVK